MHSAALPLYFNVILIPKTYNSCLPNYDFDIRLAQANVAIIASKTLAGPHQHFHSSGFCLMSLLHPRPTISESSGNTHHISSTHMSSYREFKFQASNIWYLMQGKGTSSPLIVLVIVYTNVSQPCSWRHGNITHFGFLPCLTHPFQPLLMN